MKFSTIFSLIIFHIRFLKFKTNIRPYKILFQLTNDCNSRCQYCQIWKINPENNEKKQSELKYNDYNFFLENYGKHIYWIALSGGEISIYEDAFLFLEQIKKYCPKLKIITFTTNGILPNSILVIADKIKKLFSHIDFFVTISLDGDKEIHDRLRGIPNNYELAHETYELLIQNNIKTYWGTTLHNSNAEYLKNIKDNKFKAVSISHDGGIYNVKFDKNNERIGSALKNILKYYKIQNINELFEYCLLKLGLMFISNNRTKLPIPCAALETSIHITPQGDVSPCMFLPSLGNIKNTNINDILNSNDAKKTLEKIKKEQCPKCWMNCYAPHSMMRHPLKTARALL
jgi:MoaA/NifB/PqqE/SkfB family radical SAM enzyme